MIVVVSLCVALFLSSTKPGWAAGIESITMPQADIFLAFVTGGLVREVLIKEGNRVKKGTLMASLVDKAECIELERLMALAEDTTRFEAAEADLQQKRADMKKLQRASEQGAATKLEIEHATLAVTTAELQVRMEKFQRLQHQQNRDKLKAQLERMQIVSSISGEVEEIKIEPGESVEALVPVIRVVQNDPLWIDVPVPLAEGRKLKVGSRVKVSFPEAGTQPVQGRVIHVASVADAASDTRRVRVEVPNPDRRIAGERVLVDVSQ
jgi:RND family efflux transporter MFP subunit